MVVDGDKWTPPVGVRLALLLPLLIIGLLACCCSPVSAAGDWVMVQPEGTVYRTCAMIVIIRLGKGCKLCILCGLKPLILVLNSLVRTSMCPAIKEELEGV